MNKGILIVEDDSSVAMRIELFLKDRGFTVVDSIFLVDDITERAIKDDVKLIIMDINLKDKNDTSGITLAKDIRKYKTTPIIFLTSIDKEDVMRETLEIENSYFLTKPWRELEFLSQIEKIFKDDIVKLDERFTFDFKNDELKKDSKVISLNNQQLKLLKLFLKNKNKVLSHNIIESEIWGEKYIAPTTRTALISKLKQKLDGGFIKALSKQGYMFKID
jgi:DNA-binding response OmpR family regulator